MWLRFIVSNLLNQIAEQKLQQVTSQVKQTMDSPQQESAAADQTDTPKKCDIVVAYALNIESCGLIDRMSNVKTTRCRSFVEHAGTLGEQRLIVAETGVGNSAAQQATEDLVKLYQPQWIISTGFAGALSPELHRGHILMPNKIVDAHSSQMNVGFEMDPQVIDSTPGLHVGSLITVDGLIRDPDQKRELHARFGAVACDMET